MALQEQHDKITNVAIVFGTKYGKSEGMANHLAKRILNTGLYSCSVLDAKDHEKLIPSTNELIIVITSTYRDDAPENALGFWRRLRNAPKTSFANVPICVFGNGDTNYTDFCGFAKKVEDKLVKLGAIRFVTGVKGEKGIYSGPVGAEDDAYPDVDQMKPWADNLIKTLLQVAKCDLPEGPSQNSLLKCDSPKGPTQDSLPERSAQDSLSKHSTHDSLFKIVIVTSIVLLVAKRFWRA